VESRVKELVSRLEELRRERDEMLAEIKTTKDDINKLVDEMHKLLAKYGILWGAKVKVDWEEFEDVSIEFKLNKGSLSLHHDWQGFIWGVSCDVDDEKYCKGYTDALDDIADYIFDILREIGILKMMEKAYEKLFNYSNLDYLLHDVETEIKTIETELQRIKQQIQERVSV